MTALLVIIYIAFISLGLPDSLLGSHNELAGVPLSLERDVLLERADALLARAVASRYLI